MRPRLGIADRVTTGQTDADLDAIRHRRLTAGGEDDALVAASGEVAEGIVGTPFVEQATQRGLVATGERVARPLRPKQRDDSPQQRQRSEQPEGRVHDAVRPAVELLVVHRRQRRHAIERPQERLTLRQRPGEQRNQRPPDHRPDGRAEHEHPECLPHRTTTHPRVELLARGDQHPRHHNMDSQRNPRIDALVRDPLDHIGDRQQHQIDRQQPPRNALTARQRRRQQTDHQRPRQTRIGSIEVIAVDVLTRNVNQETKSRRQTPQKQQHREHTEHQTRDMRNLTQTTALGWHERPRNHGPGPLRGNCCRRHISLPKSECTCTVDGIPAKASQVPIARTPAHSM